MSGKLKADPDFAPCPVCEDDELFRNGIFIFNVTQIIKHIANSPTAVNLVEVAVSDFVPEFSSIDESHVDSVDVTRPVILAEISPGRYNLIDGNHRMEKPGVWGSTRCRSTN